MSRRLVARHIADGIVLSTANIYVTVHDNAGATVFRTAQSASPGQEVALCHESGCRFGDIVFAKVDDIFYGYFLTLASGVTTIRRIPLAPEPDQAAEIISPPLPDIDIASSHSNLVTDGSFLYWQSDNAINKMPLMGGAVTVLDATPLTRPVSGLHLAGPNLVYAVDRVIYHVPADGSAITPPALRIVLTTATGVAALAPVNGGICVAERDGSVVFHAYGGGEDIKQAPGAAFVTSMAYGGGNFSLAWTQMAAAWVVRLEADISNYTFATGANPRLAMFNAAGDLYWLDDDGVAASR